MRIMIYVLSIIVFIFLIVFIVGLLLPKQRILTKETVYDASVETVYNSVTNNSDWEYRKSLDNLSIIESKSDFEIWEERSKGLTIRFETIEKRPYTFYSFKMDCNFFQGEWFAEFETVGNGKTRLKATEKIEYKNSFKRVIGYIFMNLDKHMEMYQIELKNKLENDSR